MHTRTNEYGQNQEVNTYLLDSLALDFLTHQEQLATQTTLESTPEVQACAATRLLLLRGEVKEASAAIQTWCPDLLENQWLVFRLKRQQFMEAVYQSTAAGDAAALECARTELAPLALNAYPEAYLDFKRDLLLLLGSGQSQQQATGGSGGSSGGAGGSAGSGVAPGAAPVGRSADLAYQRMITEARAELSESVYHTMRIQLGVQEPLLTQQLRYLLRVLNAYAATQPPGAVPSSVLDAAAVLLPPGEPSEARALEYVGPSLGPFPEADVQSLMQGAGVSRAHALDALRHHEGRSADALGAELSRLPLRIALLEDLVWDYVKARGLLPDPSSTDADEDAQGGSGAARAATLSEGAEPMEVDEGGATPGPAAAATPRGSPSGVGDVPGPEPAASGAQSAAPAAAAAAGCHAEWPREAPGASLAGSRRCRAGQAPGATTAGGGEPVHELWASGLRSASRSPPYKLPRWRRSGGTPVAVAGPGGSGGGLWDKRPELRDQLEEVRWPGSDESDGEAGCGAASARARRRRFNSASPPPAALLHLRRQVLEGRFGDAIAAAERVAPGLLAGAPALQFELRRAEFKQLAGSGDAAGALALARSELTPLANAHLELLPALKAAMAQLLPGRSCGGGGGPDATPDLEALAAALAAAAAAALGVREPRLLRLLRALLEAHRAWFKLQRCSDPFLQPLRLDALRTAPVAGAAAAATANARAVSAAGSTAAGTAGAGSGAAMDALDVPGLEDSDSDSEVDEAAVLRLMEILEVPRSTAIELLLQHGGNVEATVMAMLTG